MGTSGNKIDNVHLKWAFSEAAVLFFRRNPLAKKLRDKLERKHGKVKSITILAHKLARIGLLHPEEERGVSYGNVLRIKHGPDDPVRLTGASKG